MTTNPFKVYSPEDMSAEQVTTLFVPVAEKLEIDGPDHVFIHGHRGCGKSMMLRSMAPDCQMIDRKEELNRLPYLGIYATIKATGLDVSEYERIKNQYVGLVLAEHSLVAFLGSKVFESLREHCLHAIERANGMAELKAYVLEKVFERLRAAGASVETETQQAQNADSIEIILRAASNGIDSVYGKCVDYLRRNAFASDSDYQPYQGPLLAYRDFLFPILRDLSQLSFMPQGKPVYYLLDDADNLNTLQTQVLNTWVSIRSGHQVSFKISTQLAYKTLLTSSRQRIEAPHDFRELHVSSIHTGASSSSNYPQWVEKVVQKRLSQNNIIRDTNDFFPVDENQEKAIKVLAEECKKRWTTDPRGYRPNDDAYRYARPDYIKSLGGKVKQQSNYHYAGFQQLVHISSGIIRYFLDNAAQMYAQQELRNQKQSGPDPNVAITSIDPTVQDEVVRTAADNLMLGDLDRLEQEAMTSSSISEANEFRQLRNLIRGLGGIFYEILASDRSERRGFSIALSDDPPDNIMRILRLGVRHGYFYEAAIGTKEGRWRTRRFIMTRRLAPHFKLDPMGFSGYLFVTSELLGLAISSPKQAITSFQENRLGSVVDSTQLPLEF